MTIRRALCLILLACAPGGRVWAQEQPPPPSTAPAPPPVVDTVPLTVPAGTVLQVALAKEVRVKKVGQAVQGLLVEPVYAFDREVIPAGTEVWGRLSEIEPVPGKRRFLAALDANFSPARRVHIEFEELVLPDGTHIPIDTSVTPGSGRPIQLITTANNGNKSTAQDAATRKIKEAVQEAKRKWQEAIKQVKTPGRMHRLKRFALAQLPVHPQYIDAGTVYFAELNQPLDFGRKPPVAPPAADGDAETAAAAAPPCALLAHAQLVTPLDSASTEPDAPVEAMLTQPVFSEGELVFPQGTRLKGNVARVEPARRLKRSGKLRILFTELIPPEGMPRKVDANLEGVQAASEQHAKLGPESGTRTSSSRRRYVTTGIAVGLAVASYQDSDVEEGIAADNKGNASQGAAGGAVGFKLIGIVVGALVRSRELAFGMGLYGAGRSAYANFLGRGRDIVFPKGTAMEVGIYLDRTCEEPGQPVPVPEPSPSE